MILHQDFPTQRNGPCQTERDFSFLSAPGGSCMPLPALSSRHLVFNGYSKEQISPQTQLTCRMFYSKKKEKKKGKIHCFYPK